MSGHEKLFFGTPKWVGDLYKNMPGSLKEGSEWDQNFFFGSFSKSGNPSEAVNLHFDRKQAFTSITSVYGESSVFHGACLSMRKVTGAYVSGFRDAGFKPTPPRFVNEFSTTIAIQDDLGLVMYTKDGNRDINNEGETIYDPSVASRDVPINSERGVELRFIPSSFSPRLVSARLQISDTKGDSIEIIRMPKLVDLRISKEGDIIIIGKEPSGKKSRLVLFSDYEYLFSSPF